ELLVKTCHRRGAHAMGGMAAFIPNRRDPEVTERALTAVRNDKWREAKDGFDGTWVAHPDLVGTAMEVFDDVLGDRPNQIDRQRSDIDVSAEQLVDISVDGGRITEQGVRTNIRVGIEYMASWLRGTGAAALYNLMEDAATAEISRSQIWQWVHNGATLDDGRRLTADLVDQITDDEMRNIREMVGEEFFAAGRYEDSRRLFETVAIAPDFQEFLTLPAYELID
ncbi:MAG: malate synthase A, partial [Acidimicrobiia bacterium]|nr:malate synthase A [Acidimicrobiia bacterium]